MNVCTYLIPLTLTARLYEEKMIARAQITTHTKRMSSVVLCQSSVCVNGNPPSRLECPTCHKFASPLGVYIKNRSHRSRLFFLDLASAVRFSVVKNASSQDVRSHLKTPN